VKVFLFGLMSLIAISCNKEGPLKVITVAEDTYGVVSGYITSNGGSTITSFGLIISFTNPEPDLGDIVLYFNTEEESFTVDLGINDPYTYYVRVFASNHMEYAFGNVLTLVDENRYPSVTIGTQEWMAINLATTKYRNGDPIPNITDDLTWSGLNTGAYCLYRNDSTYLVTYGLLYNWYAVNDTRNIAPEGWHVPTDDEWAILINYLGGEAVAADKLKEAGFSHWYLDGSCSTFSTNETGFTALPGGIRTKNDPNTWYFAYIGQAGYWWSSIDASPTGALDRGMARFNGLVTRNEVDKKLGLSIRCIKD